MTGVQTCALPIFYFNFYFATPNTDYDDNTGLFNVGGNYSEFSGIYRAVQVTSSFSGGKFTQKIKNYRVRNQQAPSTGSVRSDTVNNAAPTSANNAYNAPAERATNTATASNQPVQNPNDAYTASNTNGTAFNDNTGQAVSPSANSGIREDSGYILGND